TTQEPQGLKAWERGGFCDNRLRDDDGRGVFCPFATPSFAGMTVRGYFLQLHYLKSYNHFDFLFWTLLIAPVIQTGVVKIALCFS
nr:hypothetical protein [Endozoicomonas sp.]